jgi:hypothetical protein
MAGELEEEAALAALEGRPQPLALDATSGRKSVVSVVASSQAQGRVGGSDAVARLLTLSCQWYLPYCGYG